MIIKQLVWPLVLVGLPNAKVLHQTTISKLDYTTPYADCQTINFRTTMNYNYITNDSLIKENNIKLSINPHDDR